MAVEIDEFLELDALEVIEEAELGRLAAATEALQDIPSRDRWSFPPRAWTHHVRWIAPDPHRAERLLVGIELGGLMYTDDGGATFSAVCDAFAISARQFFATKLRQTSLAWSSMQFSVRDQRAAAPPALRSRPRAGRGRSRASARSRCPDRSNWPVRAAVLASPEAAS